MHSVTYSRNGQPASQPVNQPTSQPTQSYQRISSHRRRRLHVDMEIHLVSALTLVKNIRVRNSTLSNEAEAFDELLQALRRTRLQNVREELRSSSVCREALSSMKDLD